MANNLSEIEIRILGSLFEKKMTTPEYYPLSINSLLNACNQKSNRNPVVQYEEDILLNAIVSLKEKKLVSQSNIGRVAKYNETFVTDSKIVNKEAAIICILLLRGAQIAGEIKTRTDRMYSFSDLKDVFETIEELKDMGFVKQLSRQPGQKEVRYCHLFDMLQEKNRELIKPIEKITDNSNQENEKILTLETEIKVLHEKIDTLKNEFRDFKDQL